MPRNHWVIQPPPNSNPKYWLPSREVMGTILTVFGMTQPGIRHNLPVTGQPLDHDSTESICLEFVSLAYSLLYFTELIEQWFTLLNTAPTIWDGSVCKRQQKMQYEKTHTRVPLRCPIYRTTVHKSAAQTCLRLHVESRRRAQMQLLRLMSCLNLIVQLEIRTSIGMSFPTVHSFHSHHLTPKASYHLLWSVCQFYKYSP